MTASVLCPAEWAADLDAAVGVVVGRGVGAGVGGDGGGEVGVEVGVGVEARGVAVGGACTNWPGVAAISRRDSRNSEAAALVTEQPRSAARRLGQFVDPG